MNVLICGDSFAADYGVLNQPQLYPGWPQLLSQTHQVINLAQAGCSEYKIYLQVQQVDVKEFDCALIFHTSPYRIYVQEHPTLKDTVLHRHSDLIYNDIKNQDKFEDQEMLIRFFEKYFDLDYAKFVHQLIYERIQQSTNAIPTLHMGVDWPNLDLDVQDIFEKHRGSVNHFDRTGNQLVLERVNQWMQNL